MGAKTMIGLHLEGYGNCLYGGSMSRPPITAADAAPLTEAIRRVQELVFEASVGWDDPRALACYALVDAALDVARQLLSGDLAPTQGLAQALDAALLDTKRLPWAPDVITVSA